MAYNADTGLTDSGAQASADNAGTPTPTAGQSARAAPAANRKSGGAAQQWHDWLTDPENKSFFMQAGVQLLQPAAPGQSLMGQVGSAVGAGMEAKDRAVADSNAREQQAFTNQQALVAAGQTAAENASQQELRSAQGDYYRRSGVSKEMIAQMRQGGAGSLSAWATVLKNAQDQKVVAAPEDIPQLDALIQLATQNLQLGAAEHQASAAGRGVPSAGGGGGGASPDAGAAGAVPQPTPAPAAIAPPPPAPGQVPAASPPPVTLPPASAVPAAALKQMAIQKITSTEPLKRAALRAQIIHDLHAQRPDVDTSGM